MKNPAVLGVIPARLGSTRLPRKPLHPVLGRPLLEWVWRRAAVMEVFDEVVVATDSDEVLGLCETLGVVAERTSAEHASGTDRVAEVSRLRRYRDYEVVVNLQGDEPLVEEDHVRRAVELVTRQGGWEIGTCAAPLRSGDGLGDPAVVKVARAGSGQALYFSRAPIPWKRGGSPTEEELNGPRFLHHVGLYSYPRDALLRWVELAPSPLERLEQLEQLRPLEAGFRIGVALVERASGGVDTPADVARVERALSNMGG